jgi:hypothetical protein
MQRQHSADMDSGIWDSTVQEQVTMTRSDVLKKLNDLFDKMQAERAFGQISIAFRDGEPDYIRKETTEKLNGAQGNTHAKPPYR